MGWESSNGSWCVRQKVEGWGFAYVQGHDRWLHERQWEEHLSLFITISIEDMNHGKMEYVKFGKVGLNIVWVSLMATSYKRHINERGFVRRSAWVLVLLAHCFACARVANITPIQCEWYHWGPWAWMWGELLPYRKSWWIFMMINWETSRM